MRLGGRTCPRQSQLASQLLNFPSRALCPPLRQHPCLNIRSAHPHPQLARGGRVVCLPCSPSQSEVPQQPKKQPRGLDQRSTYTPILISSNRSLDQISPFKPSSALSGCIRARKPFFPVKFPVCPLMAGQMPVVVVPGGEFAVANHHRRHARSRRALLLPPSFGPDQSLPLNRLFRCAPFSIPIHLLRSLLVAQNCRPVSQRESHKRESKESGLIVLLLQVAIDFPYLKSILQGVPF